MKEKVNKSTPEGCFRQECEVYAVEGKLLCIHTPKDLIDFYVLF